MDKSDDEPKLPVEPEPKEEDDSVKKYEEEINKRFTLPEEPVPKGGAELIEFLTKRMKLLEVARSNLQNLMDSMKAFMVEEEVKRQAIGKEQLDLQLKVGKLIEQDKLVIGKKVKAEIRDQLEDAARRLIKTEEERDKYKVKLVEQNYLIAELDGMVLMYHQEEERNRKEVDLQKEMIDNLKKVLEEMQKQNDLKDGEISEKTDQIKTLKNELDDMKGVIFKLNDVRIVLNRVMEPYSQ